MSSRILRHWQQCQMTEEDTRAEVVFHSPRLCPIFMVSNVTGHNLSMVRTFLNVLPSSQSDEKYVVDAPFEFQISDVFSVPFVGTVVVSAVLPSDRRAYGSVERGHKCWIRPW